MSSERADSVRKHAATVPPICLETRKANVRVRSPTACMSVRGYTAALLRPKNDICLFLTAPLSYLFSASLVHTSFSVSSAHILLVTSRCLRPLEYTKVRHQQAALFHLVSWLGRSNLMQSFPCLSGSSYNVTPQLNSSSSANSEISCATIAPHVSAPFRRDSAL
jgi:hypothetical protein